MNDFLNKEIEEMMFLQETINKLTPKLYLSDDDDLASEYYHTLYALTEKQHVIYTRLRFSDDPMDQEYRKSIETVTLSTGRSPDEPVDVFFSELKEEVKEVLAQVQGHSMEDEDFPSDPNI